MWTHQDGWCIRNKGDSVEDITAFEYSLIGIFSRHSIPLYLYPLAPKTLCPIPIPHLLPFPVISK